MDTRPIGMFDSGVGGMTVFKEISEAMPNEDIIYIGDTASFPYGSKSKETIIELTRKRIQELIEKNAKLIVIACGTATSQALEEVQKEFDVPIIGIIEPTVKYLKEKNPAVKVVAVEPATSAVLSTGVAGAHKIQGIGAGFVPEILDTTIYDEIIPVANEDAFALGKKIGTSEGVLVGISSGAAVWAALEVAKRPENEGRNIVVLLPDTGDRYLSTPLFAE